MEQKNNTRIIEIDGLRGAAILTIIFFHYCVRSHPNIFKDISPNLWAFLDMGWCGVDLFFIISGFLIGGILIKHREAKNLLLVFYRRRFFRIIPIYYILIFLIFVPIFESPAHGENSQIPAYAYLLFIQNFWTSTGSEFVPNAGALWSLSIEEQFYFFAPFMIVLLRGRLLVLTLFLFIVISPFFRSIDIGFSSWDFTLCRLDGLAFGVLLSIIMQSPRCRQWLRNKKTVVVFFTGILFVGGGLLSQLRGTLFESELTSLGISYISFMFFMLVLTVVNFKHSILAKFSRIWILVIIGRFSYFLYLYHTPVINYLESNLKIFPLTQFIAFCITLFLSALSYYLLEQPLIRYGQRLNYK